MIIRRAPELEYSSVTPKSVYLSRRRFLAGASTALGFAAGAAFAGARLSAVKSPFSTAEKPTPLQGVTTYNNFYEFGTGKSDPARTPKGSAPVPGQLPLKARSPSRKRSISTPF